ncbi:Proteasome subunit beta type-7 [Galemys pyrenaicus]|uniref:proteasome endopeptidase complex n=1 Tax=Galemys pyrenaicus TaxID=202257 RepID=A0A8J6DLH2_GALPY|nr:Proteasome subunit beta type-7 [Galemys pyrenaicus]
MPYRRAPNFIYPPAFRHAHETGRPSTGSRSNTGFTVALLVVAEAARIPSARPGAAARWKRPDRGGARVGLACGGRWRSRLAQSRAPALHLAAGERAWEAEPPPAVTGARKYFLGKMAAVSVCQPAVGGFSFDNCRRSLLGTWRAITVRCGPALQQFILSFALRNAILEADFAKKGYKLPTARKTGTTIAGVVYKDGIVLGADTRATEGMVVADKNCSKIHFISPNIYCCGAGTAADTDMTTQLISSNLELHSLSTGRLPRVVTANRMLKQMLFRYQGYIGAALVLGGVDVTGPHLYSIYPHGSTDKLPYVTMGECDVSFMFPSPLTLPGWSSRRVMLSEVGPVTLAIQLRHLLRCRRSAEASQQEGMSGDGDRGLSDSPLPETVLLLLAAMQGLKGRVEHSLGGPDLLLWCIRVSQSLPASGHLGQLVGSD